MTVDAERRRTAADKILALDAAANASVATPSQLPVAADRPHPDDAVIVPRSDGSRPRWTSSSETQGSSPSTTSTGASPGTNVSDERERQLALQGTDDSRRLLKSQLEQRVFNGKASDNEVDLLISTCKDMADKLCVQRARAIKAQRQQ